MSSRGKVESRGPGIGAVRAYVRGLAKPIKVGVLAKAGEHKGDDVSVAEIAFWNEFGTRRPNGQTHIPERPAFRKAAAELAGPRAQAFIREELKKADDPASTERALERVGLYAQEVLRRHIVDLRDPPNAASTIDQKGSSNPLVDTGQLAHSVSFEVKT